MITFDSLEQWQEFFEKDFSNGVQVSFVESEATQPYDDSPQDLVERIRVDDFDAESDDLRVSFFSIGTGRAFNVTVDIVEERPYGVILTTTDPQLPMLMISNKLSETQQELVAGVKAEREQWS